MYHMVVVTCCYNSTYEWKLVTEHIETGKVIIFPIVLCLVIYFPLSKILWRLGITIQDYTIKSNFVCCILFILLLACFVAGLTVAYFLHVAT